ncbi:UNVERIFIED_CONTAM: hypothetical protein FKN15_071245 [Acipenser sinensis]
MMCDTHWNNLNFSLSLSAIQFDKTYAYSILHSFGKEGKRTDYTPYSCMKIILCNPPRQGDHYGCPLQHSDPELLKQKLQSYKILTNGISQKHEHNCWAQQLCVDQAMWLLRIGGETAALPNQGGMTDSTKGDVAS